MAAPSKTQRTGSGSGNPAIWSECVRKERQIIADWESTYGSLCPSKPASASSGSLFQGSYPLTTSQQIGRFSSAGQTRPQPVGPNASGNAPGSPAPVQHVAPSQSGSIPSPVSKSQGQPATPKASLARAHSATSLVLQMQGPAEFRRRPSEFNPRQAW
eukprot:m.708949 g.708949  ORF g.708949 m.708949 type:complete len:158 (-) comp58749_c0_seq16:228-701(-)